MSDSTIYLGPILGVSADDKYHVCILVKNSGKENTDDIKLHIGDNKGISGHGTDVIDNYIWMIYHFEQKSDEYSNLEIPYFFTFEQIKLKSKSGVSDFSFIVPAKEKELNIALVSCNGTHVSKINYTHTKIPQKAWISAIKRSKIEK